MDTENEEPSGEKKPFVCGLCHDNFDRIANYYTHFKQHGVMFTSMFPACCKDFDALHHSEQQPAYTGLQFRERNGYTCSGCRNRFSTVCLLHDHLLQCSDNSGSYFYDHQQMVACPVDSCMVSFVRNETKERCEDSGSISEENREGSVDITATCDLEVTIKQEDKIDESETKNIISMLASNKKDVDQLREENCRKRNSVRFPRKMAEPLAKRIKKELTSGDKESTEEVKIENNLATSRSKKASKTSKIKRKKKTNSLKNNKGSRLKTREKTVRKSLKGIEKSSSVKKKQNKAASDQGIRQIACESNNAPVEDDNSDIVCDNDPDYNDEDDRDDCADESFDEYEENKSSALGLKSKPKRVAINNILKKRSHRTINANKGSRQRKRHDKSSEDDLRCEFCGEHFTTAKECKTHTRSHRSCLICSKKYQHLRALRIHMRSHDDVQPFPCSICGRGFNEKRSLQSHMITHTDDKPYRCDVCGAAYKHLQTLKIHERSHSKVKPYCCEVCGSGFVDWCTLKRHKIHKHTDERPFKCPHCGAGFKDNYKLSRHILTHSDVKPHQCEVCGRQMSTKSSLAVHMKKHEARQLHECSECSRKFVSKYILKDHQRTHTGEKPYKCPSCPKAHIKRAELRKHMLKHHNVDLDNMDIYPSRKHIIMGKVSASAASQFDDNEIHLPAKMSSSDNSAVTNDRDGFRSLVDDSTIHVQSKMSSSNNFAGPGERDGFRSLGDAPMDLSFLSDVVDSAAHLVMPNRDQHPHGLTLMSL